MIRIPNQPQGRFQEAERRSGALRSPAVAALAIAGSQMQSNHDLKEYS
jgi:hypothetical protein